ncbi:ankyrin repeat domain-containing protein [Pantoea sp. LMR881]|uniref:ankyrin repeat domain-containing protein n=1 Tax=Pantoea sp. LMR881 TaxID=3014336 RepID=UPI0022AEDC3D|nr:ankyrin repeat domain-containing protein [Pantoea sp. LMR881]MCZ4058756.1 ankyrin repeat domain-containing protein [Pantoea sp. LMR881]
MRRNDNYQRDVLVQAVSNQDLDTIRFLQNSAIKPKIDFNAQDIDGNNILTHSVKKGALDSLRELLSIPGMNVNHKHRHDGSLLVIAAEMNNGKMINYLLTHPDIDVNLSDDRGCTALHYAIVKKNNELAKKLLLNESCDINIKEDVLGVTAFMQAICLNNNNIASEFLSGMI